MCSGTISTTVVSLPSAWASIICPPSGDKSVAPGWRCEGVSWYLGVISVMYYWTIRGLLFLSQAAAGPSGPTLTEPRMSPLHAAGVHPGSDALLGLSQQSSPLPPLRSAVGRDQ